MTYGTRFGLAQGFRGALEHHLELEIGRGKRFKDERCREESKAEVAETGSYRGESERQGRVEERDPDKSAQAHTLGAA